MPFLSKKNRQPKSHSDLSFLSCQMYSAGPSIYAQHSAIATQHTNKSPTNIFLEVRNQMLEKN